MARPRRTQRRLRTQSGRPPRGLVTRGTVSSMSDVILPVNRSHSTYRKKHHLFFKSGKGKN
jgi:hypothetical protein